MTDYPCTAAEAVERARAALNSGAGQYQYGTGDFHPPPYHFESPIVSPDVPWTGPLNGSDCAGFAISYCWKIVRHRPGFNSGPWASVEDDVNVNSAIEDGQHHKELFVTLAKSDMPRPGDLLCYPTFYYSGRNFIGHVGLIEEVPADYKPGEGWHRLTILQCHGPNGFKPGVVRTDGAIWDMHDHNWPVEFHTATGLICPEVVVVRPNARVDLPAHSN